MMTPAEMLLDRAQGLGWTPWLYGVGPGFDVPSSIGIPFDPIKRSVIKLHCAQGVLEWNGNGVEVKQT